MMRNKKNILIFVHIPTHFKEMIRAARLLKKTTKYHPILFISTPYAGYENDIQLLVSDDIEYVLAFGEQSIFIDNKMVTGDVDNKTEYKFNKFCSFYFIKKICIVLKEKYYHIKQSIKNWEKIQNTKKNQKLFKFIKKVIFIGKFLYLLKNKLTKVFLDYCSVITQFFKHPKIKSFLLLNKIDSHLSTYLYHVKKCYSQIVVKCLQFVKRKLLKLIFILLTLFDKLAIPLCKIEKKITLTLYKKSKAHFQSKLKQPGYHFFLYLYRMIWNFKYIKHFFISSTAKKYFNYFPTFFNNYNIELIIFPEHNLFYLTQLISFIGRSNNIPSIILPFTIANKIEWLEAFSKDRHRIVENSFLNIFNSIIFNHWMHIYKNKKIILPPEIIWLHEQFNITPKEPWLLNSGNIDFIAVESEAMKNYYITAGIEPHCLRVTGALYNDDLYNQLREIAAKKSELYQSLNISNNKPIMLCAMPPNQMDSRNNDVEFDCYEDIVKYIVAEMSKYTEHFNLIINLHPRIDIKSLNFINDYPVYICDKNIAELVPLCSIFVASCSATIRMAISCAIPVLNYDLYNYNYDDYRAAPGVLTFSGKEEFSKQLNQLSTDSAYYNQVKSLQVETSEFWGIPDGKSGEILLKEIDSLLTPT